MIDHGNWPHQRIVKKEKARLRTIRGPFKNVKRPISTKPGRKLQPSTMPGERRTLMKPPITPPTVQKFFKGDFTAGHVCGGRVAL